MENCSISNNELRYNKTDLPPSISSAFRGIFWEGGYGVVFKDCVVAGNKVISLNTTGAGFFPLRGMEIQENSTSTNFGTLDSYVFENCKVLNNTITGSTDNTTAGIYTGRRAGAASNRRSTNLVLKNCVVSKTGSSTFGSGYIVSGADIVEVSGSVASDHPESGFKFFDVDNLIVKDNIANKNNIGLSFDDTPKATIQENTVSNCVTGYKDVANPTTSAWVKNLSNNNTTHYDVIWGGPAPVQSGYVGTNVWYNISLP